jgi:hypothetical protein
MDRGSEVSTACVSGWAHEASMTPAVTQVVLTAIKPLKLPGLRKI